MNELVQQGVNALRAGDKLQARRLLGRAIQQNPKDAQAWLWLSGAMDTTQEKLMCLNKVLAIDPENATALRGVASLQKQPAAPFSQAAPTQEPAASQETASPAPIDWSSALNAKSPRDVSNLIDHSKTLDEMAPDRRKALEGFIPLISQDLTANHLRPSQVIDRLSARGFPRTAVEQLVSEIAQQPIRAPVRHKRKLTKEQFEAGPSPWFAIWTNPRKTIRRIVYHDPKQSVLLLAALDGLAIMLSSWLNQSLSLVLVSNSYTQAPDVLGSEVDMSALPSVSFVMLLIGVVASVVIGPVGGLIGLYIRAWLLNIVSHWLGGKAYPVEVRAAIAWSSVPRLWGLLFVLFKLVLTGYILYVNTTGAYISENALLSMMGIFVTIETIITLWAFVVFLKCLGEVNQFSAWRALGVVLLAAILVSVIISILSCLLWIVLGVLAAAASGQAGY